jgi:hypothetical protein
MYIVSRLEQDFTRKRPFKQNDHDVLERAGANTMLKMARVLNL